MQQIPLFSGLLVFCKRKLLGAPARLPIARMEDLHTNYIGKVADGRLFLGYETMFNSRPNKGLTGKEWDQQRVHYAVMHFFNANGDYLNSKSFCTRRNGQYSDVDGEELLEKWTAELGDVELGDIEVRLFETVIDGFTFGLIPDLKNRFINLDPDALIAFSAPWDGEYYT